MYGGLQPAHDGFTETGLFKSGVPQHFWPDRRATARRAVADRPAVETLGLTKVEGIWISLCYPKQILFAVIKLKNKG